MKLLIDTHLLLWWLGKNPSLAAAAEQLIADPENSVFVSAVSLWEIRLKQSLGKLELPMDFDARLAREAFESLPLTGEQTSGIRDLPWHHRDPFDRMLVAQAKGEGLVFLTADAGLGVYGDFVRVVA